MKNTKEGRRKHLLLLFSYWMDLFVTLSAIAIALWRISIYYDYPGVPEISTLYLMSIIVACWFTYLKHEACVYASRPWRTTPCEVLIADLELNLFRGRNLRRLVKQWNMDQYRKMFHSTMVAKNLVLR